MGTVYVVQNQQRVDKRNGMLVPRFDISPASEYGDIEYLLEPTASPFVPDGVIETLRRKLKNFCDDDHLLLIGNPCLIGFAVAIAADCNGGCVKMLQWSGVRNKYIAIDAELWPPIQIEERSAQ